MIQKISQINTVVKVPIRSALKNTETKLKSLAGSSMSGYNPPRFYDTEMIIPGGLDFKEKAYYLLKGRLPKSVYERWFPNNGEHAVNVNDQLVTVQRTYSGGIGDIVEAPHGVTSADLDVSKDGMLHDISGDSSLAGGHTDVSGDGDMSTFDIFKHLAGFQ